MKKSGNPLTRTSKHPGWLLMLPLFTAACGGGTDLDGTLTDAEAGELLTALSAIYIPSSAPPSPAPSRSGPALAPTTVLIADTTTIPLVCPAGGTASVLRTDSISYTSEVRLNPSPDTSYVSSADYSGRFSSTVSYVNCASRGFNGNTWTFNASPGLAMTYDMDGSVFVAGLTGGGSYSATTSDLDGSWAGVLGWSNGSRSGECTFALETVSTSSVIGGVSSYSYSQSGVICGVSVTASSGS